MERSYDGTDMIFCKILQISIFNLQNNNQHVTINTDELFETTWPVHCQKYNKK